MVGKSLNLDVQGGKQEDDKSVDYNDDADLLTDFFFTDADLKVSPLSAFDS